jgi:hypothetical protein
MRLSSGIFRKAILIRNFQIFAQVLPIQCSPKIRTPDGKDIPAKPKMEYLGTILSADGDQDNEINRRIGCAKSDFLTLSKIWLAPLCVHVAEENLNFYCGH